MPEKELTRRAGWKRRVAFPSEGPAESKEDKGGTNAGNAKKDWLGKASREKSIALRSSSASSSYLTFLDLW